MKSLEKCKNCKGSGIITNKKNGSICITYFDKKNILHTSSYSGVDFSADINWDIECPHCKGTGIYTWIDSIIRPYKPYKNKHIFSKKVIDSLKENLI